MAAQLNLYSCLFIPSKQPPGARVHRRMHACMLISSRCILLAVKSFSKQGHHLLKYHPDLIMDSGEPAVWSGYLFSFFSPVS